MYFLLVTGAFCMVAPDWILCAVGLGGLEDEPWAARGVRILGLALAGVSVYFLFLRPAP